MNKIYLDYNATTPLDPLVLEEMLPYFNQNYGNPSSIHSFGNMAKSALDLSRDRLASLVNSRPKEITFTTGGSESNNFAIKGIAYGYKDKGNHLITTPAEHVSCLEAFSFLESQGFEVTYLEVDSNGMIDPRQLSESINESTILISCIYANNETGVVNPIDRLSAIANEKGVIFHTDAVQALGKIKVDLKNLNVDLASFSSHKICGPKGVGALYIKMGVNPVSLLHGGGQERGKRSGTENVPGIAGFGKAAELVNQAFNDETERINNLKELLKDGILGSIKGVRVNGNSPDKLPNTLNISFEDIEGESLVMNLDMDGIAVSTGSACSEGNVDPSHVLLAMGQSDKEAISSLRISIGRFTTEKEINKFLEVLPVITERIRKANL